MTRLAFSHFKLTETKFIITHVDVLMSLEIAIDRLQSENGIYYELLPNLLISEN